jgi:hypothetical protein
LRDPSPSNPRATTIERFLKPLELQWSSGTVVYNALLPGLSRDCGYDRRHIRNEEVIAIAQFPETHIYHHPR